MAFRYTFSFILLCMVSSLTSAEVQNPAPFALGLINASQDRSQDHTLEFWGYHDYESSQNYVDTLKLRYYNPLNIGDWHGTLRLDTADSSVYGSQSPSQGSGTYSADNVMVTIWGGKAGWLGNLGARVFAPLSNTGQWLAGPQVSTSFVPANKERSLLADISPLARYMFGFNAKAPAGASPPPLASRLELYPTVGLNLGPNTQIRFWDENGAVYNAAGGGWFVPIDAMLTQRLSKNLLVALGGAKQVVHTYQLYQWSLYGKVSLTF
jgi:hypothetical protein